MTMAKEDRPSEDQAPPAYVSRRDLATICGICPRTITRRIDAGTLPPPDVPTTGRTAIWRRETLEAAGYRLWGVA